MSTRAVYSFKGDGETFHVYKHMDGYPSGAAEALNKALRLAWPLPRFEPDEFGAAFIAANKNEDGNLRLSHGPESHYDLEYRYEISLVSGELWIRAFEILYGDCKYDGPLQRFAEWAAIFETDVS